MAKHIFVTGGVVSSLGKGLTCAALGRLLISRGLSVKLQKLDPYINVDPGTMNPFQHGEVFVTQDGAETDLDLGHYERFTGKPTGKECNFTTGTIYEAVISRERWKRVKRVRPFGSFIGWTSWSGRIAGFNHSSWGFLRVWLPFLALGSRWGNSPDPRVRGSASQQVVCHLCGLLRKLVNEA